MCLIKTGPKSALVEWLLIDIFALYIVVPIIKFIQIPDSIELPGVLPAEFGKGSMGTTGSVRSPWCIFKMESILLLPNQ